jgi:hypothetical protein
MQNAFASAQHATAPQSKGTRAKLFAESLPELCARVFAVELCNETGANLRGTHCFALVSVGAITKSLLIHNVHHFQHTPLPLGCALRQK